MGGQHHRAGCNPIFSIKRERNHGCELSGVAQPKQKSGRSGNQEFKFPPKVYFFKDEQVVTIFHLLYKGNKLKLPEVQ